MSQMFCVNIIFVLDIRYIYINSCQYGNLLPLISCRSIVNRFLTTFLQAAEFLSPANPLSNKWSIAIPYCNELRINRTHYRYLVFRTLGLPIPGGNLAVSRHLRCDCRIKNPPNIDAFQS